jgi:hypothetical protein
MFCLVKCGLQKQELLTGMELCDKICQRYDVVMSGRRENVV